MNLFEKRKRNIGKKGNVASLRRKPRKGGNPLVIFSLPVSILLRY